MNNDTVTARSAIESLRSGVPSRHAVAQLGTTQRDVLGRFDTALTMTAQGVPAAPLAVAANFGAGKSHLLEYLQAVAAERGFVTSFVTISPEMPLGNAHVVLRAIAEAARAPGRVGKALRALAADLSAAPTDLGALRFWAAGETGIDERFHALLLIYEQFRADEELRMQILGDFEGKLLMTSVIRARLREIGKQSSYVLRGPRNALLAHDRVRLLGQFFRACGSPGLVVFFDELERVAKFSVKQRIAVYQELGWWRAMAEQPGSGILPVFAMTDAFLGGSVTGGTNDQQRFQTTTGPNADERDRLALRGIEVLKPPFAHFLDSPTAAEEDEIKQRVQAIYERAYGVQVAPLPSARTGVRTSIRSEIRRWITQWDLRRYYPGFDSQITIEDIHFDTEQVTDDLIADYDGDGFTP